MNPDIEVDEDTPEVIPEVQSFRPLRDMVLCEYLDEKNKMQGGLWIPPNKTLANQVFHNAKVIAAGPHCVEVGVGMVVRIGEHHGEYVKMNGKKHTILRERNISGIIEG